MTDPGRQRVERRYARAEEQLVDDRARTVRRGPVSLIAVCLGIALVVGVVAAVDLRRLQSPGGTAEAWTGAALFGNCTAYRQLSLRLEVDRPGDELCLELRRLTEQNRERAGDVGVELLEVEQRGDTATVLVRVTRPAGTRDVPLELRMRDDGWAVVLTEQTCVELPCP